MTIATHDMMRSLGYCNRGLRRFYESRGLSWAEVREQGVDTAWLRQTGDAMALKLAEYAERGRIE